MVNHLAKEKNTWVYICQPTGTGKTTEMLEIGYMMAQDCISAGRNSTITVRLLVPSKE